MERSLLIEKMASYCYCEGVLETTQGNYVFDFKELDMVFGLEEGTTKSLQEDLIQAIDKYDGVCDIVAENESFDINYYTMYCPQIEEKDE